MTRVGGTSHRNTVFALWQHMGRGLLTCHLKALEFVERRIIEQPRYSNVVLVWYGRRIGHSVHSRSCMKRSAVRYFLSDWKLQGRHTQQRCCARHPRRDI